MAVYEYHLPGVCTIVDENTISAGYWLRTTPVGQKDQLINDVGLFRYFVATGGAVLEAQEDGLRISANAVDQALSGGGMNKLRVDIGKQPSALIQDTSYVLWEDPVSRQLYKTTRQDVVSRGPIKPYSIVGNPTAGSASQIAMDVSNIPTSTPAAGTTVVGFGPTGVLQKYEFDTGTIVNLSDSPGVSDYIIVNDSGTNATIRAATPNGKAGVITAGWQWALEYMYANPVSFVGTSRDGTQVTISTTGHVGTSSVQIPYATATEAGVLRASDFVKFDNASNTATNLSYVQNAGNNVINNSNGTGVTILPVTDTLAGLMLPADKLLLDSLSTSSTNLSTTYASSSVTIVNSVGTDATINGATPSLAGTMSASDKTFVNKLKAGEANSILCRPIGSGEPDFYTKNELQQLALLSTTRLIGFDVNGTLGVFPAPTGGGGGSGTVDNAITITSHGLTSGDYGKPIVHSTAGPGTTAIWDDTSATTWPTGILTEVIDSNHVRIAVPGTQITVPGALFEIGFNPLDSADGRWMSWDASQGKWVSELPADSVGDMNEMLEVLEADGSGNYYCQFHQFGPLGAGGTVNVNPGGGGVVGDVLLYAGVPQAGDASSYSLAVDTVNADFYRSTGSSWIKIEDPPDSDGIASETQSVTNIRTLKMSNVSQVLITSLTGGEEGQEIQILDSNGNAPVEHNTGIRLLGSEDWYAGTSGGMLTLIQVDGVWYEKCRTSYKAQTNLIAG